jgi:hypothetical protein
MKKGDGKKGTVYFFSPITHLHFICLHISAILYLLAVVMYIILHRLSSASRRGTFTPFKQAKAGGRRVKKNFCV